MYTLIVYIGNCVVTQKIRDMDEVAAPAGPFCYRFTKDSGKKRIACVRVSEDVDLGSDGCIARPYGRTNGTYGGISVQDEAHRTYVFGRVHSLEFVLLADAQERFDNRKVVSEVIFFLWRSREADWAHGVHTWELRPYGRTGHALITPSGPDTIDAQYGYTATGVGYYVSAVVCSRLDAWEYVGILTKAISRKARSLFEWLQGGEEDTRDRAVLFVADALLYNVYDGREDGTDVENLVCRCYDVVIAGSDVRVLEFAKLFTTKEQDLMWDCIEAYTFSGEDEREDRCEIREEVLDAIKAASPQG